MSALAYFVTWRCYGTWVHGEDGAFDRQHNLYGEPSRPASAGLAYAMRGKMAHPPVAMSLVQRTTVERSIRETAAAKDWLLLAVNVRTNHVHVVLSASETPERVMTTLKAWATRSLRDSTLVSSDQPIWSRHGSTRYLWTEEGVSRACEYVVDYQDAPRD